MNDRRKLIEKKKAEYRIWRFREIQKIKAAGGKYVNFEEAISIEESEVEKQAKLTPKEIESVLKEFQ